MNAPSGPRRRSRALALKILLALLACLSFGSDVRGFSLLGPFAPWMTPNIGYPPRHNRPEGDIGGPLNLGEEYRWNIPVITYGFDQSFLDYFGQGGVEAVEAAIHLLNDLPPASSIVFTNYAFDTRVANPTAGIQGLCDLKSATLTLLLEQLGLAAPGRFVWIIRRWDPSLAGNGHCMDESCLGSVPGITNYIQLRNYDPLSQQPSKYPNGCFCSYYIFPLTADYTVVNEEEIPVDPNCLPCSVSDGPPGVGIFYTSLAQEDVAGILYLLSSTNVNVETLDETIMPVAETNTFVRTAPRPGIGKLTFVRQPTNTSGDFATLTNQFVDVYFANHSFATQLVQRAVMQPDLLFSAKDLGVLKVEDSGQPWLPPSSSWQRNDTSRWNNNNVLNGNPAGDGPGVIRPPVKVTFHTPGRYVAATGGQTQSANGRFSFFQWASFDASTNPPVVFPGNETNLTSLTLSTKLVSTSGTQCFQWDVLGHVGARYRIEASPDLASWTTNSVLTNTTGIFRFTQPLTPPRQFFRAVLEN